MKKYKIIILIIAIIAVLGIIIYKGLDLISNNSITKNKNANFIKLDINEERFEPTLIDNESDLKYLNINNNKTDIEKHNYVLFNISYDSCSHENVEPYDYSLSNGKLTIKVKYKAKCGGCAPIQYAYLLELPKTSKVDEDRIDIDYKATNNPHCDPNVAYKPLIYLYPTEETNVKVELGNPEYLTTTYPKYNNSWNVTAYPDGTLKTNNREYYSLFWEGNNHQAKVKEDGFIVKGSDTEKFLEEKLNVLGLTDKEANEFIIYWLPKLENNKYNYIRFESLEEINNYMPLSIEPQPDTIIRVMMDYKPINKKIKVTEQTLQKVERNGFTVVEWGGSQIA